MPVVRVLGCFGPGWPPARRLRASSASASPPTGPTGAMRPRKGPNRTHYLLVFTESNRSSLDGSKWRSLATFATTPTRVLPLAVHGSNAASLFVSKLVGSGFDHTHDEVGPEGNVKTPPCLHHRQGDATQEAVHRRAVRVTASLAHLAAVASIRNCNGKRPQTPTDCCTNQYNSIMRKRAPRCPTCHANLVAALA